MVEVLVDNEDEIAKFPKAEGGVGDEKGDDKAGTFLLGGDLLKVFLGEVVDEGCEVELVHEAL